MEKMSVDPEWVKELTKIFGGGEVCPEKAEIKRLRGLVEDALDLPEAVDPQGDLFKKRGL